MISGLILCSVISLALGTGAGMLLWPKPDEKDAAKFRREAILTGLLLAIVWPLLLVVVVL